MITKEESKLIGSWDKAGRYYLFDDFQTESSKAIREPSRRFPWSIYKHIFTKKYFNSLTEDQRRSIK